MSRNATLSRQTKDLKLVSQLNASVDYSAEKEEAAKRFMEVASLKNEVENRNGACVMEVAVMGSRAKRGTRKGGLIKILAASRPKRHQAMEELKRDEISKISGRAPKSSPLGFDTRRMCRPLDGDQCLLKAAPDSAVMKSAQSLARVEGAKFRVSQ